MAELAQSHPEFARRYQILVRECWARGWLIGITSSTRSRATQEDLYARWLAGSYKAPSVANPNNPHGTSPWGWTIVGSYHMPQADGYSHALDLNWQGCTPDEFEQLANRCGMQQTVPNENWHYQWFNRKVIFPIDPALDNTEEDVTPQDYQGIADALMKHPVLTRVEVSASNPVGIEATVPLETLLSWWYIEYQRANKA